MREKNQITVHNKTEDQFIKNFINKISLLKVNHYKILGLDLKKDIQEYGTIKSFIQLRTNKILKE